MAEIEMMRNLPLLLAVLAFVVCVPACGEPSDELKTVGDKLGETWDAAKAYSLKKRDEADAWFTKQVDAFPEKLAAAKKKAAAVGDDAAKVLDEKWAVAQEKYDAMKAASGDGWKKAKDEFVAAWEALQKQIDGGP